MSTDSDRTEPPESLRPGTGAERKAPEPPPRPAFPPRPTLPPRPGIPPMPSVPPETPGSDGESPAAARLPAREDSAAQVPAQHAQKDEPTAQMPHDTEADGVRPAARESAASTGSRLPLPAPAPPKQPPPPTGEPLTSPGLRRNSPTTGGSSATGSAAQPAPRTGTRAPAGSTTSRTGTYEGGGRATGPAAASPGPLHPGRLPQGEPPVPGRLPDAVHRVDAHAGESGPPTAELRAVNRPGGNGRPAPRTVAAAVCLVLGVGLLGGAGAGITLTDDTSEQATPEQVFEHAGAMWQNSPVNELFPRVLEGVGAGPGGADRKWLRVAVAPDSDCRNAFDPLLAKALAPVGCERLLRATYADETTSSITTVGLLFTRSEQRGMRALRKRFAVENLTERTDLMPRPYAARGTVAADFGDAQRASWTVRVLSDAPVVVYAVTGFADGRTVSDPQAAAEATEKGETSAAAQAGLGHDAQGIADRIERRLRNAAAGRGDDRK